jgi:hypothetical protein
LVTFKTPIGWDCARVLEDAKQYDSETPTAMPDLV